MATHYEVLDVGHTAPVEEIRRAYLRAALANHPDVDGGRAEGEGRGRRMQEINEAWAVLRDPAKRAGYDLELARLARVARERSRPPIVTVPQPAAAGPGFVEPTELVTAYRDVRPIPRPLLLVPPALVAAAVVTCLVAVVLTSQWLVQLGLVGILVGVVLFIAVQLLAMVRGARS